jgi:drug/metabolite transporter superfamily protein YnfA
MSQTLAPWIVLGYAAADPPDFAAVITNITTGLQPVFLPIAGLSLTVFLLLLAGAPIFGDATAQYKGFFMRICLIVTTVGLIPTLLSWLYGLGSGAI